MSGRKELSREGENSLYLVSVDSLRDTIYKAASKCSDCLDPENPEKGYCQFHLGMSQTASLIESTCEVTNPK